MGLAIQAASLIYSDIGRLIVKRKGDPNSCRASTHFLRKFKLMGYAFYLRFKAVLKRRLLKHSDLSEYESLSHKIPTRTLSYVELSPGSPVYLKSLI